MAAFSTIALAALTGVGTASQYNAQRKGARATEDAGEYEAQLFERNADLADLQGADAIARGREAELKIAGETRQVVGSQRTSAAAQGIDINDGSAADVQGETNAIGAFDALTVRNNADREAWGYKVQAADARNRAELTRRGARNLAGAQRSAATGTLLTGGASLAGQARSWSFGKPSAPASKPFTKGY